MLTVNKLFVLVWHNLSSLGRMEFILGSFLIISLISIVSGIRMTKVQPDAAGSGIPQLKVAYWKDLGAVPSRAVLVEFIGGILALVGGANLGREGPTVFITGGLSSNVAGWLGVPYRRAVTPPRRALRPGLRPHLTRLWLRSASSSKKFLEI